MSKECTGLWVPINILENGTISAVRKIILSEIASLQKSAGCFASNRHFASRLGISERQTRNHISALIRDGHVRVEDGTSKRRRLWTSDALADHSLAVGPALAAPSIGQPGQISPNSTDGTGNRNVVQPGDIPADEETTFLETRKAASTETTARSPDERTKETTKASEGIVFPEGFPTSHWKDWLDHNRAQGRRVTDIAAKVQIKCLEELDRRGNPPHAVIEQSIMNNWKGFFELPKSLRPDRHTRMDGSRYYAEAAPSWQRHAR